MSAFQDGQLDQIGKDVDDGGKQRLGEVASLALQDQGFRQLAFTPGNVKNSLKGHAGLESRLSRQDLGALGDAELRYCERWAQLANTRFGGDDAKLVEAINATSGDRGPSA